MFEQAGFDQSPQAAPSAAGNRIHLVARIVPVFRLRGQLAASMPLLPHQSQAITADVPTVDGVSCTEADVAGVASRRNR